MSAYLDYWSSEAKQRQRTKRREQDKRQQTRAALLAPQHGPQAAFMDSEADITIYGGAAGGGKSWAILAKPIIKGWHKAKGFTGIYFRQTLAMATKPGGLKDEFHGMYLEQGASIRQVPIQATFEGGAKFEISQIQYESDKYIYQGTAIAYLAFDELTHFSESAFFYLLSRNRSMSGVRPVTVATCNPDPDSWVAGFIAWWIDPESGYPVPERAGAVRWLARDEDTIVWADSKEELIERGYDQAGIKSVTFIPAKLEDNKALEDKDPNYRANLMLQPKVDRERLLGGNWKIRVSSGDYFQKHWFEVVDVVPHNVKRRIRRWDFASTKVEDGKDPDWTVGTLLALTADNAIIVEDIVRFRDTPSEVKKAVHATATRDGTAVEIIIPEDPGSAGKAVSEDYIKSLIGYNVKAKRTTGDKEVNAKPASSQAEARNIKLKRGPWNDTLLAELEAFPRGKHDDQVDTLDIGELINTTQPLPAKTPTLPKIGRRM